VGARASDIAADYLLAPMTPAAVVCLSLLSQSPGTPPTNPGMVPGVPGQLSPSVFQPVLDTPPQPPKPPKTAVEPMPRGADAGAGKVDAGPGKADAGR
jgi:hypothetical protein